MNRLSEIEVGRVNNYNTCTTDACAGMFVDSFNVDLGRSRSGIQFVIVMLDFSDFYELMKLKIQYQK